MKNTKENQLKLKHFSTFCLASFIALLTLFGTACNPTQSNTNQNTSTTTPTVQSAPSALGLDPENDPVIYTTESGLEIKYGGLDLEGTLASGNLKGYPYFTMGTYSGKAVNWVIIGRAPDVTQNVHIGETQSLLFSTWKANSNNVLAKYFASNTFETNSPAGSAINASTASKSYVVDNEKITTSLSSIVSNEEIDNGCVLVISEGTLGSSTFGSNIIYEGSTVQTYCQNLYHTNLGLPDAQKALIKPQDFVTNHTNNSQYCTSTNQYMFLSGEGAGVASNGYKEKFGFASYLPASQFRLSVSYWIRSSGYNNMSQVCSATGSSELYPNYSCTSSYYVRPACVISLQ